MVEYNAETDCAVAGCRGKPDVFGRFCDAHAARIVTKCRSIVQNAGGKISGVMMHWELTRTVIGGMWPIPSAMNDGTSAPTVIPIINILWPTIMIMVSESYEFVVADDNDIWLSEHWLSSMVTNVETIRYTDFVKTVVDAGVAEGRAKGMVRLFSESVRSLRFADRFVPIENHSFRIRTELNCTSVGNLSMALSKAGMQGIRHSDLMKDGAEIQGFLKQLVEEGKAYVSPVNQIVYSMTSFPVLPGALADKFGLP
jgi:hypothetical protein